jgi:hypothetical protein
MPEEDHPQRVGIFEESGPLRRRVIAARPWLLARSIAFYPINATPADASDLERRTVAQVHVIAAG